jgi:5'-deoxy-5'-methylthioadenosine phosphorylase
VRTLGLIGGSGLDQWGSDPTELQLETPWGSPSGPLSAIEQGACRLLFLARHGPSHDIAPHLVNYRANLWALREAGAQTVIAVNAVGGIAQACQPGGIVLPDQLIDYTWGRPHSYGDEAGAPVSHIEFTVPFSPALAAELGRAAEAASVPVIEGACVGVTQGPRLETAAEIRRLQRDGCDLVGMTSMPEAALARELGLEYASLCVVANRAAGLDSASLRMADIEATLVRAMVGVRKILAEFAA